MQKDLLKFTQKKAYEFDNLSEDCDLKISFIPTNDIAISHEFDATDSFVQFIEGNFRKCVRLVKMQSSLRLISCVVVAATR